MKPEELFGKDYDTFCEVDPFNRNEVEGWISRKPNEYYGALIITKVNGKKTAPQLIMGSPKMRYPFVERADGTRNYVFPSSKEIEAYVKLDGTNILAYRYSGGRDMFVSYKTRLRPFVRNGRYGPFLDMWKEIANEHFKTIRLAMMRHDCNLSFEMYGARNRHLIVYKVPLAIALLFGVTNTGRILSPTLLSALSWRESAFRGGKLGGYVEAWGLPVVRLLDTLDRDYVWGYEEMRKEMEAGLRPVEENYFTGEEGAVWYMHTHDGLCLQYKCKPASIEAEHWKAGMSKNSVIATCWNAYENMDKPTVKFVKQLLQEEFDAHTVEVSNDMIRQCIAFVAEEMVFRTRVLEAYRATGLNVLLDKAGTMRALSPKFTRSEMKKVYSTIALFA